MRHCSIHNLDYLAQCDACAAREKDLDGDERLVRKQGLIATAELIRADREVAALAELAPRLISTLESVRSTLMGLLENKASHTTEGVTGYVHFMRIEIDKALADAEKAGA